MNPALDLAVFSGVMALTQFSPGPDMLLVTQTSLKRGVGAGVRMAFGIGCGLMIHTALAVGGLALAFESLPVLRTAMSWLAAAYLIWLAWRMTMEAFVGWYSGGIQEPEVPVPRRNPFLMGLWCNLLNPKVVIFLAAVSAPFLKGARPDWWPLAMWAVVVAQGTILWALWSWLLQWRPLRSGYQRAAPAIDAAFALILVTLAVWLVLH